MTVYLCTCGTSAAKNIPKSSRFDDQWVTDQGGIKAAAQRLYDSFKDFRISDELALSRQLSAEIHSLARMKLSPSDRVVLFSSETTEGRTCAEAVKCYLELELPGLICVVEVVEGLQVRDATRFRSHGVEQFVKQVLKEINSYGALHCVLNPTGGFKSLVPYTVLIGMIKGVEARYIFEQSRELITLPAMPVEFARERLEPIKALMERIQRDSYIPRAEWERAIPFENRRDYEPLFEQEGQAVTLSPIGLLVWEEIQQPTALVPYLSRAAIDDLKVVRGIEGCKPVTYIQRVARDRTQLENGKHEPWSHDLFWLKPGAHTRDRYLVSIEGWRLLVWRMTDHDDYDELLQRARHNDLGKRFADERRSRYEPFFRMDLYETS